MPTSSPTHQSLLRRRSLSMWCVVKTEAGVLRGRKVKSARRGSYYSFQGIPYGKPPVGDLRFKSPLPADPWPGVKDALVEGFVAPSVDFITKDYGKDCNENCLNLNVYTPMIPEKDLGAQLKAVMFWIHGGGFSSGSGNTDLYGPDYLVTEDVVVVTCNYRLGALGFLSLGTPECPGNYGLKDIVLALKWCQSNISRFGGDPAKVTIFGESAGGAAVHYLCLSPKTEGLFHRAIAQSGVSLNPWAIARHPRECAYKLTEALGCKADNDSDLLRFLRAATPEDLVLKSRKILAQVEPREYFTENAFVPCVEPETPEALFTKDPTEAMKDGQFRRLPFLLGANTLEGIIMIAFKGESFTNLDLDDCVKKLIPVSLNVKQETKEATEIEDRIRNFYFPNGYDITGLVNALSSIYFLNGINQVIEFNKQFSDTQTPTFVYRYAYVGDTPTVKNFLGFDSWKGTCHGDELVYLFKNSIFNSTLSPGTNDYANMETLTKIWTDFAKTANPTPDNPCLPISKDRTPCLEIAQTVQQNIDFNPDSFHFWKQIHAISTTSQPNSKL